MKKIFILLALSGCSAEQMHATGQYLHRSQCMQQADQSAQMTCLRAEDVPYSDYKRARGENQP